MKCHNGKQPVLFGLQKIGNVKIVPVASRAQTMSTCLHSHLPMRGVIPEEMTTGDLLKIFFILMCLWYVTGGQQCGSNPLNPIIDIARRTGRTITYVLEFTKRVFPEEYNDLERRFRAFARCVGLVDTGYFKRSLTEKFETSQDQLQRRGQRGLELPGTLQAAVGSSNTLRMLTGKRSVAAATAGGGDGGGDADGAAKEKSL